MRRGKGPPAAGHLGVVLLPVLLDLLPGFFGRLHKTDEFEILTGDHAEMGQVLEVDDLIPEPAAEEDDREGVLLAGLDERQGLEEFIEGPEGFYDTITIESDGANWLIV